jgi:archaemetzincin
MRARVTLGRRAFLLAASALALVRTSPARASAPRKVYIQPLGAALPAADSDLVRRALLAFYRIELSTLVMSALPRAAFYAKRRRYRAEKLLDFLDTRRPDDGFRILGLTAVDISTTKPPYEDWGILGLATLDGGACVLSSFRCKRGAKNPEHARIRLGKTAVHEIGHTFGLPHCPTYGCLMEDARGKVATTDREYDLCPKCRQRLIASGYELGDASAIPWPKPER